MADDATKLRKIYRWRAHVISHVAKNFLTQLGQHMPAMSAIAGWGFCTLCNVLRFPGKENSPKDKHEALLRLSCQSESPAAPEKTFLRPVGSREDARLSSAQASE